MSRFELIAAECATHDVTRMAELLAEAGLAPNVRGETLDIPAFAALSNRIGAAL